MRVLSCVLLFLLSFPVSAQSFAYLPGFASDDVSVVSLATNTVVDTIAVGDGPFAIGVTSDGQAVYVGNFNIASLTVIDAATNTVTATIPLPGQPYAVLPTPDGSRVYVGLGNNQIVVVDTGTNTVTGNIPLTNPVYRMAFHPDGVRLFAASQGPALFEVDTSTDTLTNTYPQASGLTGIAISDDGAFIYVTGFANQLLVLDAATGAQLDAVNLGSLHYGIEVLSDGSRAYLAGYTSDIVTVVDLATNTIEDTIPLASVPFSVTRLPDDSRVYVSLYGSGELVVIDTATNLPSAPVAVSSGPYAWGHFIGRNVAIPPPPVAQGVQLDAVPGAPVVYAEEIVASPGAPVTLLNPAGDLNLSANLGYSFSIGEVRYARFECDNGLVFDAGSAATYDGAGSASLGAINGLGDSAMHFSITANNNYVTSSDRLVITGDRQITGTTDVNCTYSLYDFPSQAAAGGPAGRVYTVSGPYLRFAPSYAMVVDAEGNPVADVESNDPAYSEFTNAAPTNNVLLGRIGSFTYGTVQDVTGAVQPLTPAGTAITLIDLMGAETALVFSGDFSAASSVFFGVDADCALNAQAASDFSELEAVFIIGSNGTLVPHLCFVTDGVAIPASEYTISLEAASADPAAYAVTDLGPLDLGVITRNGTELQAPLAQVPGGWLSRVVLTNTGTQDREYEISVSGETGTTISTNNLSGIVEAQSTLVVDLDTVLTGFTGGLPRATLNVTVAAPNRTIQGLYQIVNPDSGSISNHVMVRPGTN